MFCKKGVLTIPQNSEESTCARVSFSIKLQISALRPRTLLKWRLWHRCFLVNLAKFLRSAFFIEHLWWLFLNLKHYNCNSVFALNLFHFSLLSLKNFDIKFRAWHVILVLKWHCILPFYNENLHF